MEQRTLNTLAIVFTLTGSALWLLFADTGEVAFLLLGTATYLVGFGAFIVFVTRELMAFFESMGLTVEQTDGRFEHA